MLDTYYKNKCEECEKQLKSKNRITNEQYNELVDKYNKSIDLIMTDFAFMILLLIWIIILHFQLY